MRPIKPVISTETSRLHVGKHTGQSGANRNNLITIERVLPVPTVITVGRTPNVNFSTGYTVDLDNLRPLPLEKKAFKAPGIHLVLMNAQSVRNKTLLINEYVRDDNIDLLAITETWLKKDGDAALINELVPEGYTLISVPRNRGRGGGIGLLHRDSLSCKLVPPKQNKFKHMELMRTRVTGALMRPLDVYVLYRPPSSAKNSSTITAFLEELETLFSDVALSIVPSIIVGDFNIHFDVPAKANKLIDLLDTLVNQHIPMVIFWIYSSAVLLTGWFLP